MKRAIDTLRISVTDRCNLRCNYCMPAEGITPELHERVLTFEEIIRLSRIFAGLGIKKIRITGGEPLVRKDIVKLVGQLAGISGIEEVAITTNGIYLSGFAAGLKEAGIKRINISLDTLKPDRFKAITGGEYLYEVLNGIKKAKELGFSPIKINTVVMRGVNDDEVTDFLSFSLKEGLTLRFIEFMKVTPLWNEDFFMPIEEVKDIVRSGFGLEETEYPGCGPAQYYKAGGGIVGFIKTDENNCQRCNRLRITSTGELKLCLYETGSFSLNELLRNGTSDDKIRDIISAKLRLKEGVDYRRWECGKVYMSALGG